jgi:uncharacterized membrane protein YfcA
MTNSRAVAADAPRAQTVTGARAALLVVLGVLVGTWSSACGVGGGVFAVPILHYLFGMPLKMAIGNSLILVAASTFSATITEVAHADSAIRWDVVGILVTTSFLGTQLGYKLARGLETLALKRIFCIVLAIVAIEVLFDFKPGTAAERAAAGEFHLDAVNITAIAAIGFVSGFVAPLLGIGGGLIAVPALFLGFPALGYLAARASSMAMSVFASWQSVWLYRKDRQVHVPTAAWFAAGAVCGGYLGVMLVHVPGVSSVAQRLLGLTLAFVAARFAWDVWRSKSSVTSAPGED